MHSTIEHYLDQKCPVKTFKIPADRKPWINDHLVNVLRDKNNLLAKARRTKSQRDFDLSDLAKKEANRLTRCARRKFVRDELRATEKDNKKFWHNIQKLMPKGNMSDYIQLCDQESKMMVPENEIPTFINSFFTSIGPKLSQNMFSPWKPYDEREVNNLNPFQTTENEVKDLVKDICVTKSSAIDNVSNMVIRYELRATTSLYRVWSMESSIKHEIKYNRICSMKTQKYNCMCYLDRNLWSNTHPLSLEGQQLTLYTSFLSMSIKIRIAIQHS